MKCQRCTYEWKPRTQTPKKCPACQVWLIKLPKPKPNDKK